MKVTYEMSWGHDEWRFCPEWQLFEVILRDYAKGEDKSLGHFHPFQIVNTFQVINELLESAEITARTATDCRPIVIREMPVPAEEPVNESDS